MTENAEHPRRSGCRSKACRSKAAPGESVAQLVDGNDQTGRTLRWAMSREVSTRRLPGSAHPGAALPATPSTGHAEIPACSGGGTDLVALKRAEVHNTTGDTMQFAQQRCHHQMELFSVQGLRPELGQRVAQLIPGVAAPELVDSHETFKQAMGTGSRDTRLAGDIGQSQSGHVPQQIHHQGRRSRADERVMRSELCPHGMGAPVTVAVSTATCGRGGNPISTTDSTSTPMPFPANGIRTSGMMLIRQVTDDRKPRWLGTLRAGQDEASCGSAHDGKGET